ncbi:hypothetical protein HJC23_006114 [Cyclotella cryptica]|uniref:LAGLIDADG homing endonuclease n=1 Tax=Cyclotella cryptica TaxID=29204 RepID=A0ABD3QJS1_9STRA
MHTTSALHHINSPNEVQTAQSYLVGYCTGSIVRGKKVSKANAHLKLSEGTTKNGIATPLHQK